MAIPEGGPRAVVALGANLGRPEQALRRAAATLARLGHVLAASSLYRTRPVGGPPEQPHYCNAVLVLRPAPPWSTPEHLLSALLAIEVAAGRTRRERWGPRSLDLDLITFEGEERRGRELHLPHPRASERAFVMIPLAEIWPAWRGPGGGARAEEVAAALDASGVEATDVPLWP
ncbi:2-amino-4-hydroxy-6-hydroxymethyldihydropteridinediphosphokinase [soil metagenome]|nr:2-amino-4-hydroxy-6-hydroxymethyldihydropteridine diphosphokinase [Trueperaceae bacterium]